MESNMSQLRETQVKINRLSKENDDEAFRSAILELLRLKAEPDVYDPQYLDRKTARVFVSYAAGCFGSRPFPTHVQVIADGDDLTDAMLKIQRLQMGVDDLESQYHQLVRLAQGHINEAEDYFQSLLDDLQHMHKRTEKILLDLLGFFDIKVDSALRRGAPAHRYHNSSDSDSGDIVVDSAKRPVRHRFHEALLLAFLKPDNPLRSILGQPRIQRPLRAWKRLRNQWVKHRSGICFDVPVEKDMVMLRLGMPTLIQSLKDAVLKAGLMAQMGDQVMRFPHSWLCV